VPVRAGAAADVQALLRRRPLLLLAARQGARPAMISDLLALAVGKARTWFPRRYRLGEHVIELPVGHPLDWYRLRWRRADEPLRDLARLLTAKHGHFRAIDIGANVGDSAALIVGRDPVELLCIEGNPAYLPLLRRNLAKISAYSIVEPSYVSGDDATIRGRVL